MLADTCGDFAKATDLTLEKVKTVLGRVRNQRFSILVEDGKIDDLWFRMLPRTVLIFSRVRSVALEKFPQVSASIHTLPAKKSSHFENKRFSFSPGDLIRTHILLQVKYGCLPILVEILLKLLI